MMRTFILIFISLVLTNSVDANTHAERYETFIHEVRCIVCQNQSLADSNAPLAIDLREKIQTLIAENKSDEYIKSYLVKRYGEFILLRPRFNKLTYVLWLLPFLMLVIGIIVLARALTVKTNDSLHGSSRRG